MYFFRRNLLSWKLSLLSVIFFYSILTPALAFANSDSERIGLSRGLEADIILALLIDHRDFMWVGTKNGLFVYDGYQVHKHVPHPTNPNAISALDIRNIYQSKDHIIWVSTNSGGLNKYDASNNTFTHYRHQSGNQNSISNDSVYDVVEGPDGHLWIATQIGLNRLDRSTGEITRFYHDQNIASSLPSDYVYRLFLDSDKRLWIGTIGGGLAYWDSRKQQFHHVALPEGEHEDVFAITEDADKHLWIGTRSGLLKLNPARDSAKHVEVDLHVQKQPLIIELHFDKSNKLAIGTSEYGLILFDIANNQVLSTPQKSKILGKGTVTSIVENRQNTLFVGTWGAGLQRVNSKIPYLSLIAKADSQMLQPINNVSALLADQSNQKTWVGTLGNGLHWLEHRSGKLSKVTSPLPWSLVEGVHSIAQLNNGQLYVGTSQGLWHLSATGKTLAFFKHVPTDPNSIGKGYVRVIEPTPTGNLWVGVGGTGLHYFNPTTKKFTVYSHDSRNARSLSGDYITSLLVDDKDIWVGTRSSGLNRCNTLDWSCQRFKPDAEQNNSISHFYVTDIARDTHNQLWIGTDGGGLNKVLFDERNNVKGFHAVSHSLGFMSQSIISITPESDGALWLTTKSGISLFNPLKNSVFNLIDEQLFNIGSFSPNSSSQGINANLFGALGGLIRIERHQAFTPPLPAPIRFTKIEHESLPSSLINTAITDDFEISLPWGKVLTLEFALLDFSEKGHDYEYRLTSSTAWLPLNKRKHMTFFQMAPGLHEIEVRGRGNNGQWSPPARINIEIKPPWWMNKWLRLVFFIILVMMFTLFHRMRVARLMAQSARLQALQDQKQVALNKIESRELQLSTAYQGLRSLATQLQNAKEDERKSISRELHDEFGQTLTATKINLQLYKKFNYNQSERIEEAIATTQTMIQQVRAISFNLRPALLDDEGLVAAIKLQLEKMSTLLANPIALNVSSDFPIVSQRITSNVFRIIQESVNNALRHANADQIVVTLTHYNKKIFIEIKDNGKGFDVDKVKDKTLRGIHLGLLGMEERVHSLLGTLTLHSTVKIGSIIKVVIPNE